MTKNGMTIFVVSNQADANAMTEALAKLDIMETENKSLKEQAEITLNRIKHSRKAMALDSNEKVIWQKDYSLNREKIEEMIPDLVARIKKEEGASNKPIITVLIGLDKADDDLAGEIRRRMTNLGIHKIKNVDLCFNYSTVAKAVNGYKTYPQKLQRLYLDPNNKVQKFLDWINSDHHSDLSTGFPQLDKALGGGLSSGLYVLGAPSSIGKSTLALQIADYLAEHKHRVLYYSLEMDSKHIIAKSVNRIAFKQLGHKYHGHTRPTAMKVYQGMWQKNFDREMYGSLLVALQNYADISLYVRIEDTEEKRPTAQDIYDSVDEYIAQFGESPVIIIDYLQLLRSPEDQQNQTDKQRVSDAIWKLKTISRDFNVPVIAISSFNRANYNDPLADMSALKESGEIDYSAETIITLGYDLEHTRIGINPNPPENVENENQPDTRETISKWQENNHATLKEAIELWKQQEQRAVKVRFLKNRYGAISKDITLYSYPRYDLFYNAKENGDPDEVGIFLGFQPSRSRIENGEIVYKDDDLGIAEQYLDLPF